MKKVIISVDSAADLPRDVAEKYGIEIMPMHIVLNGKERNDGVDTGAAELFDYVEKSVEILKSSGIDYELRTTIVKEYHTLEDIVKIGEWIKGAKRYFLQGFVDSGALLAEGCSAHEKNTLEAFREAVSAYVPSVQIRGV